MKTCTACARELPLDRFYRSARGRLGRQSRCIECAKAAATARRLADPEGHRLAVRRHYLRARQRARERAAAREQQEILARRRETRQT